MLQRRTFLGLLGAFGGGILGLTRALAGWKRPQREDGADSRSPSSTDQPGIKITTIRRQSPTNVDVPAEPRTFYLQGEWRRLEFPRTYSGGSSGVIYGPRVVNIVRPDLKQIFELNLDASQYAQRPYPPPQPQPLTKEQLKARGIVVPSPDNPAKPTFRIETVTKDTGERKDMFGYMARHVITTRKEIPLEGSRRGAQEITTDGWYIDLEPAVYPSLYPMQRSPSNQGRGHAYLFASTHRPGESPQAPEKPEFIDIGEPETGFVVRELRSSKSTLTSPDGTTKQIEQKTETNVTIERGHYDVALFEVPARFKRVQHINPNPVWP